MATLVTDSPPLHFIMAGRNTSKVPPLLSFGTNYEDWCKMVRVWTKFTDLVSERQGPSMFLSLKGEVLYAALELYEKEIGCKNGVEIIMAWLDKLCKKDDALSKFQALEAFGTYKRPSKLSIPEHINEFGKCLNKVKIMVEISLTVFWYTHFLLIKATISDLSYGLIKDQLIYT